MAIRYDSVDTNHKLSDKRVISEAIKELVVDIEHKRVGDITFVFCSDKIILDTNNQFLNHNYFTDVITFDYCEGDTISGDIMISVDTVRSNAQIYNVEFLEELHRVIFHGVLHLIGYGDKSDSEAVIMRQKEDENLVRLNKLLSK